MDRVGRRGAIQGDVAADRKTFFAESGAQRSDNATPIGGPRGVDFRSQPDKISRDRGVRLARDLDDLRTGVLFRLPDPAGRLQGCRDLLGERLRLRLRPDRKIEVYAVEHLEALDEPRFLLLVDQPRRAHLFQRELGLPRPRGQAGDRRPGELGLLLETRDLAGISQTLLVASRIDNSLKRPPD